MDGWVDGWKEWWMDWQTHRLTIKCCFKGFCHVFRRVRKNCEKRLLALPCLSVCPQGTTRLPLDRFSWNLIFTYFPKICRESSVFIKIGQKWMVLYVKINIHLRSYLTQFSMKWKMLQIKVVKKLETHFMFNNVFIISCRLWDKVVKCRRAYDILSWNKNRHFVPPSFQVYDWKTLKHVML
jgi:hypothetical protein